MESRRSGAVVLGTRLLWIAALAAVLLAGVLALSRIAQPAVAPALEAAAVAPWGLPVALLATICAVLLLVVSTPRRGPLLLLLGTVALVAVHVWALAPLYRGSAPAADAACELTVMTQNLEGGDGAALAATAAEAGVDVLVVVEPGRTSWQDLRQSALSRQLRYVVGAGDDGPSGIPVLSRFPLTESSIDDEHVRVVSVQTPCAGSVDLVAVHPHPPYRAAGWARDQAALLDLVTDRYGPQLAAGDGRIVLAGDFNATFDHAAFRRLLSAGFTDAAEQANSGFVPTWPAPGTATWHRVPLPPLNAIDHVLLADGLVATTTEVLDNPGADHRGILARVHPRAAG